MSVAELVVAGGYGAELFSSIHQPLDQVAFAVAFGVEVGWSPATAPFAGTVGFLIIAFEDRVRDGARAHVWAQLPGGVPASRFAGDQRQPGTVVLRIDGTITPVHSKKDRAAGTYKKSFGMHPLACWRTWGTSGFSSGTAGAGGAAPGGAAGGLAAIRAQAAGWDTGTYAEAAAAPPGTSQRDTLVSALPSTFFTGAGRSGEYLDLDTGLAVVTRHAQGLGYDALVCFLDELILWLSTKIADHTFVQTEGAKLNKLVESSDATRPVPLASFVAKQRNLEEFLGPQVGGTERAALADVMRSVQGRFGADIVLADTNLPEITEKRLLKPADDTARTVIDDAFAAVRGRREVWDTLLLGAQYGDAGIGSDAEAFRRLYPFSPALVQLQWTVIRYSRRERPALVQLSRWTGHLDNQRGGGYWTLPPRCSRNWAGVGLPPGRSPSGPGCRTER